ncbi:S41 family peptidase [Henriciella sp.]|uniref:S41 family peptidase n=1 Tax=Henriciella sp. TaxID=1968823 RepID=UPI0026098ADC|nr:S41 family peptidase [Henriciella sp.]
MTAWLLRLAAPLSAVLGASVLFAGAADADRVSDDRSGAEKDVSVLCELVRSHYAYYEARETVWEAACRKGLERARRQTGQTPAGHLDLLEGMLDQLYDNHVSLSVNSADSPRLVPSGSDYHVEMSNGAVVVTAVRPGSGAARAGLAVGDRVTALNGVPVLSAAMQRMMVKRNTISEARLEWALNAQAAGYRDQPRRVTVERDGDAFELDLGPPATPGTDTRLTVRRLDGDVGYIRFEDSLGQQDAVTAFNEALEALRGVDGWILDLRNTPGGGNTGVAEPVLARFIRGVKPYQRTGPRWHEDPVRRVASRGPWRARGRVAVLVGRWTGSMGEGMAVGFDGMRRGRVFGSEMAGLAGGIESFDLPASGYSVRFPTYNLMHLDGTDRHLWRPPEPVLADNGNGEDLALEAALDWVAKR